APADSASDVLVPEFRVCRDEGLHHRGTPIVLQHVNPYASRPQQIFLALERLILADDDAADAVEQDGTAAHGARRQRRVHHRLPIDIGGSTAGALERIHLPVEDRTPLLNAPIVPAAQNDALVDERRADGNATLGKTLLSFFNRDG